MEAHHLGAQGPPVPVAFKSNDAPTPLAGLLTLHAHQLQGALGRFRARRQQKGLLEARRRDLDQIAQVVRPDFRRVVIGVKQGLGQLLADGLDDARVGVPGVGDEDGRREVDPGVAPRVMNLKTLGAVPDDGQLPVHGPGLVARQIVQDGLGLGNGNRSPNPPKLRFDPSRGGFGE